MKNNLYRCPLHAIGSVSTSLYTLQNLGVPYPNETLFNEFGVRYVRGDLSQRGDGFPSAIWKWLALDKAALNTLVNLAGGWSAGSGAIYITTKTNQNGQYAYRNFACSMYLPDLSGADGTPSEQDVDVFNNVGILFAGLVAY